MFTQFFSEYGAVSERAVFFGARRTTEANRGGIFGLNQSFQAWASFATAVVFGALSGLDLRLPWAWFALCLAAVAWLVARPEPAEMAAE
ncbi:hypothetical protein BEN47_09760 [Hymenobacter lapidarius]|uniref:Major facilitator superfamily (MFS) profile domain-containing protein n=1 Tax=Hymenobacter lapidarius TaxID=1908237 RepID=A0A1G1TAY6_9BACT|nr:hypothetical protein [Hymenobacter lapidarius]OGX88032.1 hypothetical protein BEN47_09760 [Hymenobacter lapidarius]